MNVPTWKDARAFYDEHRFAILTGAGGAILLALYVRSRATSTEPDSLPPDDVGPRVRSWQRMPDGPLALGSGEVYRAIVSLPWYVPNSAATPDNVAGYAAKMGFVAVRSWRSRPDGFPGTEKGDVYVEATWGGGYSTMDRPSGLVAAYVLV